MILIDILSGILTYIVPFLCVLTAVVFFHELGHFAVARWCGIAVESFSIGFGREIAGYNDKHGTRWKLSILPLGGYVKFVGDMSAASVPDREHLAKLEAEATEKGFDLSQYFYFKPVWQRSAVVAAGPFANFILAIVIYAIMFMTLGYAKILPYVGEVMKEGVAYEAGFQTGDLIKSINGNNIEDFRELKLIVSLAAESDLSFVLERAGQDITISVKPERIVTNDRFGNVIKEGRLGITPSLDESHYVFEKFGPFKAIWKGTTETYMIIDRTLVYLGRIITGREDADQLGGPIRIAQMSGQVAQISLLALIQMTAVLSVSIGLINLFPVPLMDGGHLVFYGYEAARGKPLSEQAQEYGFRVGLALILMLMVFATWNDLNHLQLFERLNDVFS